MPSNRVTVKVKLNVKPKEEPVYEYSKPSSMEQPGRTLSIKQILLEGFIIFLVVGLIANILKGVGYPFFTDSWIFVWLIVIVLVIIRLNSDSIGDWLSKNYEKLYRFPYLKPVKILNFYRPPNRRWSTFGDYAKWFVKITATVLVILYLAAYVAVYGPRLFTKPAVTPRPTIRESVVSPTTVVHDLPPFDECEMGLCFTADNVASRGNQTDVWNYIEAVVTDDVFGSENYSINVDLELISIDGKPVYASDDVDCGEIYLKKGKTTIFSTLIDSRSISGGERYLESEERYQLFTHLRCGDTRMFDLSVRLSVVFF